MSRSAKLRRYGKVYRNILRGKYAPQTKNTTRRDRTRLEGERKQPLNEYQQFIKHESKKEKYIGIRSSTRLQIIAQTWRRKRDGSRGREKKDGKRDGRERRKSSRDKSKKKETREGKGRKKNTMKEKREKRGRERRS